MKLRLLAACTLAALALTAGSASAQDTTSDKGKLSYALGYRAGVEIARVAASGEQVDTATVMKAFQDAVGRKEPTIAREQLGMALQGLQDRMVARAKAELDKRVAENKTQGEAFLAANKGKPGVKVLPSGVQYRVIESGSGPKATQNNLVTIELKSTLPDGTVIDDTSVPKEGQQPGPYTGQVSQIALPGLREVLQQMPTGSRWEVVLPAASAYGTNIERSGEMTNQVLIFNIKLLSITAAPPAQAQGAAQPPR